ncbi:MAG TPA: ATP-binding protein [Candidatus Eisenbacteria bacterium]|jgi:serine/threonine-protein kinase RsbW|nr:ATP-binding protein [Candidatus Eisenbacteria bacterium]HZV91153.1 ATP-binding protein [Candidatus Nitrosocosmicus sp.]
MERRFQRDLSSLPELSRFVADFLTHHGLSPSNAYDLDLILEELFTNVLKYGSGKDEVLVGLTRDDSLITIAVREFDAAKAYDITRAPEPDLTRPIAERKVGGLGIHMVRQLAETIRYEYKDRVSTTTITKKVSANA